MVDFDIIRKADWFALPVPFQKGISFPLASILGMGVMSIAVAIETIGDLAAITKSGADREITAKEVSGGLMGDGVGTALVPESVQYFPRAAQALLETGIIQAAFLAIILNLALPDPEAKR